MKPFDLDNLHAKFELKNTSVSEKDGVGSFAYP